ncbi:MAG: DsbA family protein [Pseudomonadales bacterium]|nr:DsbA family protein [Pseudomonadales bacterium]
MNGDTTDSLAVDYYSDILCVWAWIAQRRNEELLAEWKDRIVLRHHFVNVFGNTADKIGVRWSDRGGYEGFGEHVVSSAAPYESAPVRPDIWRSVRPTTSANAHTILKAVELNNGPDRASDFALVLRRSFFVDNADVGRLEVLYGLAQAHEIAVRPLQASIASGEAIAALMQDYHRCQELGIKGSPSWILNEGRQVLFGNVGYRVLNANIAELMKHPGQEASWC